MAMNTLLAVAASSTGIVAGFIVSKMAKEELHSLRRHLFALYAVLLGLLVGVVVTGLQLNSALLLLSPAIVVGMLYARRLPNITLLYCLLAVLAALAAATSLFATVLSMVFLLGIVAQSLAALSIGNAATSMMAYIALFALLTI